MKRLFLLLFLCVCTVMMNAQDSFKWDKRFDSDKTKADLFALTKMFIAENWNSAQYVTQNSDEENGVVLVKGRAPFTYPVIRAHVVTYYFSYTIKFFVKDLKYRIVIDDLDCVELRCGDVYRTKTSTNFVFSGYPLLPLLDEYPQNQGKKITGMKKESYEELTGNIKEFFEQLISEYEEYMKQEPVNEDW